MVKRIAIDINDVLRDYTRQFADTYKKNIDNSFDIKYEDINDFNFLNIFPFLDENGNADRYLYNKFKYEDYSFEIFGRAEAMDRMLPADFNLWTQNTMRNFDEENLPEIILFSPFEMNLSIQSTLSFLARFGIRVREIHFPIDSVKMWDKCDIMITANPHLLEATPDNKISFKVNAPYNKEAKGTFDFESMMDIIHDENNTLIKLIEND
jgi:5'(3')-deoxyribonucleotidase